MAEEGAPVKGGYKQLGGRNESTQKTRDAAIAGILKTWNITDFDSVIPAVIKPARDLGNSAICNIRAISRRTTLAAAQDLFLSECKDETGAPVRLSFGHTAKIVKDLLAQEVATKAVQGGSNGSSAERENAETKLKLRRRATEPVKKTVGTPKTPNDLVIPRKTIPPPFTFGSSPTSKKVDVDQTAKSHTRGLAIKKTIVDDSETSKSSVHKSAFGFLDGEVSPIPASKKRPLPPKGVEENGKQERGPPVKKNRKEEKLAGNPVEAHGHKTADNDPVGEPVTPLRGLFSNDEDEILKPLDTSKNLSGDDDDDDDDVAMAELNKLMQENKAENEKLFGALPRLSPSTDANEKITNATTPKPTNTPTRTVGSSKEALASLAPGVLKENLPELEGDTIVVDAGGRKVRATSLGHVRKPNSISRKTAETGEVTKSKAQDVSIHRGLSMEETESKTTTVAPVTSMSTEVGQKTTAVAPFADMGTGQAPIVPMHEIQQPKQAAVVEPAAALQATALEAMASLGSGPQPDPLKEHCSFIATGFREVLDTEKLVNLARPEQQALTQDIKAVLDTALRHLEGDLVWVFKQHGSGI